MITLKNWSVVEIADPYLAPECHRKYLIGEVYGHPNSDRFYDGKGIQTSSMMKAEGRRITTESGTVYNLEDAHPDFLSHLKSIAWEFDPENPIIIK